MSADKQRFDRCLTPMGTVPISVIYGFHYPVNKRSRTPPTANPSDSVPRRGAATSRSAAPAWPSSLASSRTEALNVRILLQCLFYFCFVQGRNDRVVKSVEPSYNSTTTSRNFRVSSPTFKDVGYSSKVINSSKQIETNKKNAPVLNNSYTSNRGYTSTWRSPVRYDMMIVCPFNDVNKWIQPNVLTN